MLGKMRAEQNSIDTCLELNGVRYKFLNGVWENEFRVDPNYVVTSDRRTYRIGPDDTLHIEHLAGNRGGLWLGKPHRGQVQITGVYNRLFPETAKKRPPPPNKGKKCPRIPHFPTEKAVKKTQRKASIAAKEAMKSDGAPPSSLTYNLNDPAHTSDIARMKACMVTPSPSKSKRNAKGKKKWLITVVWNLLCILTY